MAEDLILSILQKLECWRDEFPMMYAYDHVKTMLDFLRENNILGDGSSLKYFMCDFVDAAQEIFDLVQQDDWDRFFGELEHITCWVQEAKVRMLRLGVINASETESPKRSENVREDDDGDEDVIGLEEDVEMLLREAILNREQYSSISVIRGMTGIGKTTLAKQLYKHTTVVAGFERRVWVCVSGDISYKEVLMKLIQQVVDRDVVEAELLLSKMEQADNASLRQMLHQYLQGMRYFIVLDDVPNRMNLKPILKSLPFEDKGSVILLTSQSRDIRAAFSVTHEMKTLDSAKSWKLFLKTLLRGNSLTSEQEFPKHLEKKGKEMLRICGGVPLAIKEMGRQIAKKRESGSEWDTLLESIDLGATLELLEPSYHRLDPQLKSCFLHLAFLKENTTMKVEKLKQLWAAGGMVSLDERDQPTSYMNMLIKETFIEVKETSRCNGIKSCLINPLLHRLSIKKAEDEIGFEILGSNGNSHPSQSPRHRAINCCREKFDYFTDNDKHHLVSLFFRGGGYFDCSPSYWKSLEKLQILDLEDFGLKFLPEVIGTLMELRYLGLRNNYIKELPHSLGCLKKLEVLDIALNLMMEMPDIVWEMTSLRHLYMSDVVCRTPLKIDRTLENLETLTYISIDNWTYEVSSLPMLRKLGIEELDANSDVSTLVASLSRIWHLDSLVLKGFRCRYMPCLDELGMLQGLTHLKLDGLLAELPGADNFPPNIRYLKLVNTCLDEDPIGALGRLPKLEYLKLRNAYTGERMSFRSHGFHSLQVLCIQELWNLTSVVVEEYAMWIINELEIINCPHVETLLQADKWTFLDKLKIVTTKDTAKNIRDSGLISKVRGVVDISP